MTTSTIEKILLSLSKQSDDKKVILNNSYQEKSLWLKNELECIRKLIEQNPRDPLTANAEEAVEKTTESVPAAPSSSSVTFKDDDSTTRKRKSPETAYSHVDMMQQQQQDKVSPHQKRTTSFDLEDVLTKLNLPINLDRLTKGQLLSEVEKRGGCGTLSMKSLKKELIDGLKERLLDEYKRSAEAAPSNACQTTRLASNIPTAVSVEDKSGMIEASLSISAPTETQSSSTAATVAPSQPTPSKGVRKGSLMEEFRHLVNSSNLSGTGSSSIASNTSSGAISTSSDDKDKVAAEFQARQNRHRDSMARKSQLQMEYSKSSSSSSSSSSEITQHKAFSDPTTIAAAAAAAVALADDEQVKASSQNEIKSDDRTVSGSTSTGTANGGIWCDVSSPMKTGEEGDVVVVADEGGEEGQEEEVVIVEVAVDKSTSGGKEQQVVVVETAASSVKAAVAAIQQKAINEEPKVTSKVHTHTSSNSNNTAAKAPQTKMGGGSTTHNKTAATAKTVVSSQPHLSTHATEAQSAAHAAPVKKGLFSGMSMFGSKKTVSPPATVVSTSTSASQSKATAVAAAIVSPITDHQVSPTNTTTTTSTTNDGVAASVSIPHANSEVQSVPVASSIAVTAFDVTAVASSDAVVQKHLLTTTTTANEGKKKDARLINAIAPSAAVAIATNTAPTTSTSSSSLKLKDAFASKNLITSIVSNYNAALASPTPLLLQSASVPSISMHPVNATTIATTTSTDSLASASSVTSSSLSDTVPSAASATTQQQQVNEPSPSANDEEEYIIEDRESSDDESGTDDEESEEKKKQSVPEWARGTKLREALELQYGFHGAIPMDPDLIFPEVQSCSLEEIFGCREGINRKYHNRTSSAHWDADELTLVEKRTYRKHMGYDKPAMVGGI